MRMMPRYVNSSFLIAAIIGLGAIGVAAWQSLVPQGQVSVQFYVPRASALGGSTPFGSETLEEYRNRRASVAIWLTSPGILHGVLRENGGFRENNVATILKKKHDPLSWLKHSIHVNFPNDGEIMTASIYCSEKSRQDSAEILDALARAYLESWHSIQANTDGQAIAILHKNIAHAKETLQNDVEQMLIKKEGADTPALKAEALVLEKECDALSAHVQQARQDILALQLSSRRDQVSLLQSAKWIENRPWWRRIWD